MSVALAAVTFASTAGTAFAWDASAFSHADEQLLFSLTNQDRARAGLNALVNDAYLDKEAEWRAQDMGDRNYFSHQIPPANNQVYTDMRSDGYCFNVAGENIGESTYPDEVVTANIEIAFMGSPGHRANILGTWARIGVGAYKAADGRVLYAVLFSIPCGVTVAKPAAVTTPAPAGAPKPAPTVVPTRKPTAQPTAKPTATAGPTATLSTGPTPSPTDLPTYLPTEAPSPTLAAPSRPATTAEAPTVGPSTTPSVSAATIDTSGEPTSLRVRDEPASRGLLDSLFSSLFGGLFGS